MSLQQPNDGVARALLPGVNLKVSVVVASAVAQEGRLKHGLQAAAASLLGQALTGAALMVSLQKDESRVNLQLECDGPLRGLLVDASASGDVRGYVKNPHVAVELAEGPFRWRAALGNSGFVSVLREVSQGEYYRSSVELTQMSLADDLNKYFAVSEQVATRLALDVVPVGDEPLALVAGVLIQTLPDGDGEALENLGAELPGRLRAALTSLQTVTAQRLLTAVFAEASPEIMATYPLRWRCSCSKEKVVSTLAALGRAEVQDILDTQGSTAVTCQFCSTRHEVTFHDLMALLESMGATPRD